MLVEEIDEMRLNDMARGPAPGQVEV
jgi:hypothetical protein